MTPLSILHRRAARRAATALAAIVALSAVLWGMTGGDGGGGLGADPRGPGAAAGASFFDRYVDPDGRVVRRDQGDDTVSEGQAYAMLLAVAGDDEARFTTVWDWTRRHLQRPDGLLSWHWRDGAVVDPQPAADADIDAARALALAARRFSRPELRAEAARMARAVLDHETVAAGSHEALAAGPWAVAGRIVNPSYFSPCGYADLAEATGDARWRDLAGDAVTLLEGLTDGGRRLPPDWARLDEDGRLHPDGAPGDRSAAARYGLDAARVAIRLAEPCEAPGDADDRARRLAAELWPTLRALPAGGSRVAYRLDGTPAADARHPLGLVAAAAAAAAAGEDHTAQALLDEGAALDRQAPTYYGAAWLALAATPLEPAATGEAVGSHSLRLIAADEPAVDQDATTTETSTAPGRGTTTEPSTTTSTGPATTTTTTAGTTSTSSPSSTTTAPGAGGESTVTTVPGAVDESVWPAAEHRPPGSIPRPLQPGVLTRPPSAGVAPPAVPGSPAPGAAPADDSGPARTAVLLAGAGLTAALGVGLGRRSL